MSKYFSFLTPYVMVLSTSIQQIFEYRVDLIFRLFRYILAVSMYIFLWTEVAKQSGQEQNIPYLIQYFLIGAIIYGYANFHTSDLEIDIRFGNLSRYLVKPYSAYGQYAMQCFAEAFIESIIKAAILFPVILLSVSTTNIQNERLLILPLYLPFIFFSMYTLYFALSTFSFWIQNSESIRFSVMFFFRFLSGFFIPLSFFPSWYQSISFFLPFQHVAYTPIQFILGQATIHTLLLGWLILALWTGVWGIFAQLVWTKATHQYESAGI